MVRQLTLMIVLALSFQVPQALGQAKCKGSWPTGPGRGGTLSKRPGQALIKVKPEPQYTKAARRHEVQGTVVVRVVLHSSGKVTEVCVVQGLPHGLTKRAVAAAYKIEFEPAVKEGRSVSSTLQVEYNFNTY